MPSSYLTRIVLCCAFVITSTYYSVSTLSNIKGMEMEYYNVITSAHATDVKSNTKKLIGGRNQAYNEMMQAMQSQ